MKRQLNIEAIDHGTTLAACVRRHLGLPWNKARDLVTSGKVKLDGKLVLKDAQRLTPAARVLEIDETAPRQKPPVPGQLVYDDGQVVVIDKPEGVMSVPFEDETHLTAMDLVRDHWRRKGRNATTLPLHVVHRIDKDTSGLLAFAVSKGAERALATQFRNHTVDRLYLCVAHGKIEPQRIESELVEDRGDGLRGRARDGRPGKLAVTHILATEPVGELATLCTVQLETGKTHQIRIHFAELGHPLVGETVYVRDYRRRFGEPLPCKRLLLHAATLGFVHPTSGEEVHLEAPLPEDFVVEMEALRRARRPTTPAATHASAPRAAHSTAPRATHGTAHKPMHGAAHKATHGAAHRPAVPIAPRPTPKPTMRPSSPSRSSSAPAGRRPRTPRGRG